MRTSFNDTPLKTELTWKPHAHTLNPSRRGALVGTLLGVEVTGKDFGRSVAYQYGDIFGRVRTVFWDGTVQRNGDDVTPFLYDVDTEVDASISPRSIAWFSKLS